MSKTVLLTDIVHFLGDDILVVHGSPEGIEIRHLRDPQNVDEYTLDWINPRRADQQNIAEASRAKAIIVSHEVKYSKEIRNQGKALLVCKNPKLCVVMVAEEFFVEKKRPYIHPTTLIHPKATIGKGAYIGPNVVVGCCKIGQNIVIVGNSVIYDNVIIGNDVEIHNGVSIGSEAHNFVKKDNGELIKFPHFGGVIIENNVVIGANSVISRGVLENTIIKKGCKIAQLVFIGANNIINENCVIRPNAMTSGSVTVGFNTIIAPSVTIREQTTIGQNCIIGLGAVVTKNVPSGETWVGNPAKKLEK